MRCKICKKEMLGKRSDVIFCSTYCRNKFNRGKNPKMVDRFNKKYWGKNKCELNKERRLQYKLSQELQKMASCRNKVKTALKNDRLFKKHRCENCDSSNQVEAHHWDYNKPLEVVWLCHRCHCKVHKNLMKQEFG